MTHALLDFVSNNLFFLWMDLWEVVLHDTVLDFLSDHHDYSFLLSINYYPYPTYILWQKDARCTYL